MNSIPRYAPYMEGDKLFLPATTAHLLVKIGLRLTAAHQAENGLHLKKDAQVIAEIAQYLSRLLEQIPQDSLAYQELSVTQFPPMSRTA